MRNDALNVDTLAKLSKLAKEASTRAHAPYSKFKVGAALQTRGGTTFTGCNVENASYGLTCCAERTAIFSMVASGAKNIDALVIYTPTDTATAPCGACRQVITEFGPDAKILSVCDSSHVITASAADLLPHRFGPENL